MEVYNIARQSHVLLVTTQSEEIVRTRWLHDADAGNGVAHAGKPAAAKLTKASGPNAKRGASRAATKDQRGIMSFFAKK